MVTAYHLIALAMSAVFATALAIGSYGIFRKDAYSGGNKTARSASPDLGNLAVDRPDGKDALPAGPILVSACLLGEPCRYDGKSQPCQAVIDLGPEHDLVPVCPEQLGGLPTPRVPSEVQPDGRVLDAGGVDRTGAFEAGAREALRIARDHACKLAVLKENSPSCGVNAIYDGTFSGRLVPGRGKTAALLGQSGIRTISDADCRTASALPRL